jgi:hypothetical protein
MTNDEIIAKLVYLLDARRETLNQEQEHTRRMADRVAWLEDRVASILAEQGNPNTRFRG